MSINYQDLAELIKKSIEMAPALSRITYQVRALTFGTNSNRPQARFYCDVSVPIGEMIIPRNQPYSGTTSGSDLTDMDTEEYRYTIWMYASPDQVNVGSTFKDSSFTIFDFMNEIRNTISKNWIYDESVTNYSFSPIRREQNDSDASHVLAFDVSFEVEVVLEGR